MKSQNQYDLWELFPYPTIEAEVLTDGSTLARHPVCVTCRARDCVSEDRIVDQGYGVCRQGLLFAPLDSSRTVVGLVGANLVSPTPKARQRFTRERDRHVRVEAVLRAIGAVQKIAPGMMDDIATQRALAIEELKTDPTLLSSVADVLRRDLEDNFSQSHDFLQLVKIIRGHAEVLLHAKHPDLPPEEAADLEPTEGAIYYATTLMSSKVDSLVFLNEINRAFGELREFEIHPLLLKYVRIYAWQASQKRLKIDLTGRCFAICYYNLDAIIAVIQGLLDNLVKYAPANSRGQIDLVEDDDHVVVSFCSLGPRIAEGEAGKIFLPRFRGHAARELEPSGQGVGLGIIKELSDVLNLAVSVKQSSTENATHVGRFETVFSVRLAKVGTSNRARG